MNYDPKETTPSLGRPFRGPIPPAPIGLDPAGSPGLLAPEPQTPAPPAPAPELALLRKLGPDLQRRVLEVVSRYPYYDGADDARNRDLYKGEQWKPSTAAAVASGKNPNRPIAQNETFPVVDSLLSTLITTLPQVDFSDARQRSQANPPDRSSDLDVRGRAIASVYNAYARLDDMGEALETAMLNALIFNKGGIIQTSWDSSTGRPCWQALTPDEVFFDPVARRHRDIAWAFRLTQMHWDDFKDRIKNNTYTLDAVPESSWIVPTQEEPASQAPLPTLVATDKISDPVLQIFRPGAALPQEMNRLYENPNQAADRRVYPDYVPMIEWYDCRRKLCYHIHRASGAILGVFSMPVANPFRRLVPNLVPGEKDGVSVVSLIAAQQQVVNELSNGRLEVVRRIVVRLILSKALFQNDEDREKFLKSSTWEPVFVDPPEGGRPMSEHVGATPAQPLSFDFNNHLNDAIGSMQKIAGSASFMRGVSENVRTAEEASMIRGAVEHRLTKMNEKVIGFVTNLFEDSRAYLKWAIRNPEDSKLDVAALAETSQADMTPAELADLLLSDSQQFQLAAFNPLMKDANTRRKMLAETLPIILGNPALSQAFNLYELARELAELCGMRLSTMNSQDEYKANLQAMSGAPAAPPPEESVPPEEPAPAGMTEEDIVALLAGAPPMA